MNRLKGQLCYLAGFIDADPVSARGWREEITTFLNGIEVGVLNPCDKAISNISVREDEEFVSYINKLKEDGEYEEVTRQMKEIVRVDLKMCDICNFCILNINRNMHMCGSYFEYATLCQQRKPVLVYCEQGIQFVPNFIWGIGDWRNFHANWNNLKRHITDIAYSPNADDLDGKWRFFDYDKIFGKQNEQDYYNSSSFNPFL